MEYELFRSQWRITEWRDGCVFKTEHIKDAWFTEEEIKNNKPLETNVTYGPPVKPSTTREFLGIRKKIDHG